MVELSDIQLDYATIAKLQTNLVETYRRLANRMTDLGKTVASEEMITLAEILRIPAEGMEESTKMLIKSFDTFPNGEMIKDYLKSMDLLYYWTERNDNELEKV